MNTKQNNQSNIIHLSIRGMSGAGCVSTVEKAILAIAGITKVDVKFAEQHATVYGKINEVELTQAVSKAGYEASIVSDDHQLDNSEQPRHDLKSLNLKSLVAGLLGLALMMLSIFDSKATLIENSILWISIGLLTAFVMWFSGRHFFIAAWTALKRHLATMDTLIALGIGGAWSYSMLLVLFPSIIPGLVQQVYFEAIAIIICFLNLGSALELRAKNKSSQAIQKFIALQAKTAWILRDSKEVEIAISNIVVADIMRVKAGEIIAADGVIVTGESIIDESMITAGAIPVIKTTNDKVIAGTSNGDGSLLIEVQGIGTDTLLSQIIAMLRHAELSKPSISRLVDKVAAVFVPSVLIFAIITFLVWNQFGFYWGVTDSFSYAIVSAMAVLVIASPRALGLATPISLTVGVGHAAQQGILIRNSEVLQRASKLAVIVLDKTGTITEGRPDVVAVHTAKNIDVTELLQVAASVDAHCNHPIAIAIVDNAKHQQISLLDVDAFHSIVGKGVRACINNEQVYVGNDMLMQQHSVAITSYEATVFELTKNAITPIYVAKNNTLLGIIGIADAIKSDSKAAVHRLIRKGLLVIMLSGDNIHTAHAIATQVGITQVIAEVLPDDKAEQIKKLQAEGLQVGMVGDGINDAPALASAAVGFAIGTGSDTAIESADVSLIRGSLHGIADAIEISNATLRNIKQNLYGVFIYNIIGIPLAAGVFFPILGILLPAIYAAGIMALSSITVISNANRLHWFTTGQK